LDSVCKFYKIPSKDLLFIVNKIINLTPEDFSNFLKDYYFINLHLGSNNKHKDLIKKLETEIISICLYINNDSKTQEYLNYKSFINNRDISFNNKLVLLQNLYLCKNHLDFINKLSIKF
jgi:hypothetical protein